MAYVNEYEDTDSMCINIDTTGDMIALDTDDTATPDATVDTIAPVVPNVSVTINHDGFPHIVRQIIQAAPFDVLKTFRLVCHQTKALADARLLRSVILTDPGHGWDLFELHAPAGEFETCEASSPFRLPIDPIYLTVDRTIPYTDYHPLVGAFEPLAKHVRVVEVRMQAGLPRSCALLSALENVTRREDRRLDAYRVQSGLKNTTNATFIGTELEVHFASLAHYHTSPQVDLGFHSPVATTIVVNVDYYDSRAWKDAHAAEIWGSGWCPFAGMDQTSLASSLTFVFHPFNADTALHLPVARSPFLDHPHHLPFGIMRSPISIASRLSALTKFTLVGAENLKPSDFHAAAQMTIDASTAVGRKDMAALVAAELTRQRELAGGGDVPVECLSMEEFRDRIGEEQYALQVVRPPPPVERAPREELCRSWAT